MKLLILLKNGETIIHEMHYAPPEIKVLIPDVDANGKYLPFGASLNNEPNIVTAKRLGHCADDAMMYEEI